MRVLSIVCLVLALACAVSATQFMSDEHRKLGDLIFRNAARHATSSKELHEAATVLKQIQMKGADRYLQVNPQHLVSFGDLVAMSGDFFAVPTTPISGGKTLADHLRNFEGNYKTFADASDVESTKGYLKVEREIIEARRASGLSYPASYVHLPKDLIAKGIMRDTVRLRKYWDDVSDSMFRMQKEVSGMANYDHLAPDSHVAYEAGHTAAMRDAVAAKNENDPTKKSALLERAIVKEGISQHFLTDCFSAGHTRQPRAALIKVCGAKLGSAMNKCMHDEDGLRGMHVMNAKGEKWVAHGDTTLFEQRSKPNRDRAVVAGTAGILEVLKAFQTGTVLVKANMEPLKLVPTPHGDSNHRPMFARTATGEASYRNSPADETHNVQYLPLTGALSCANAYRKLCFSAEATCFEHKGVMYTHAEGACQKNVMTWCDVDDNSSCKSDGNNPCKGTCLCLDTLGPNTCTCAVPAKESHIHCTAASKATRFF